VVEKVRDWVWAIRWAVGQPDEMWRWVGAGGLAALIAIWLIARALRS
jgi:hypothetical protein